MEPANTQGCHCRSQGESSLPLPVTFELMISKLFTVGVHELFHLAVGLLCGGQVVSICIDPNDGGATHVLGLMRDFPRVMNDPYAMPTFTQLFWSPSAVATLAAGYVGSSVVGFVLVVRTANVVITDKIVLLLCVTHSLRCMHVPLADLQSISLRPKCALWYCISGCWSLSFGRIIGCGYTVTFKADHSVLSPVSSSAKPS